MSGTEQGWPSRGHFYTPNLLHVFFCTVPALQMDPPLPSSFPSPAQTAQISFALLESSA